MKWTETKTHSGPIYFICFCNSFVHFSDSLSSIYLREWCESWHLFVPYHFIHTFIFLSLSPSLFIYLFMSIRVSVCLFLCSIPFHFTLFFNQYTLNQLFKLALQHKTTHIRIPCAYTQHVMPFQFVKICQRKKLWRNYINTILLIDSTCAKYPIWNCTIF